MKTNETKRVIKSGREATLLNEVLERLHELEDLTDYRIRKISKSIDRLQKLLT